MVRWNAASSWVLEAREVDTDKDNWSTKEGHGPADGADDGYIAAREFEFTKKTADSRMLFTYNDNLRVYGSSKACRWEIHVDGASCPSGIMLATSMWSMTTPTATTTSWASATTSLPASTP